MKKISFVIPCYCSENTLPGVVQEIETVMASRSDAFSYEVILVNDASPRDHTRDVIEKMCQEKSYIKGLSFSRNFGQHSAVMAGFSVASGDYIVNMDDDGQIPLDELFLLVDKLEEGYDLVFAKYIETVKRSWVRQMGTRAREWTNGVLLEKPREIVFNSFFIARRFVIEEVLRYKNPYPYLGGLLYRATHNVANVEVHHRARAQGSSGYTLHKLIRLMLNEMTSFSVKPLRVATIAGLLVGGMGFLWMLFIIGRKIFVPTVDSGYSSLMATILFLGGLQLITVGLLGEYIGRIYISLNNSPQYVIKERFNIEK